MALALLQKGCTNCLKIVHAYLLDGQLSILPKRKRKINHIFWGTLNGTVTSNLASEHIISPEKKPEE
jgi:hypothetical protein